MPDSRCDFIFNLVNISPALRDKFLNHLTAGKYFSCRLAM